MKLFSQNSRFTKLLSLTVVSALLMNDAIACSIALHTVDFSNDSDFHFSGILVSEDTELLANPSDEAYVEAELNESLSAAAISQSTSGGPGQAEIQGSTANMGGGLVNSFTGDLAYSLPLMSVEGFPITLSYDPNIGMDQEASWVGLGWNLSLGSINRDMRGIPDDFQGDQVERTVKMKDNTKDGSGGSFNLFGSFGNPVIFNSTGIETENGGVVDMKKGRFPLQVSAGLSFARGKYFDNYTGEGLTRSFNIQGSLGVGLGYQDNGVSAGINTRIGGGIGFSSDSQNGRGTSKSGNFNIDASAGYYGSGLNGGYSSQKSMESNSRTGIKTQHASSGFSWGWNALYIYGESSHSSKGSMRTFGVQNYVPRFSSANYGFTNFTTKSFNASAQYLAYSAGMGGGKNTSNSTNSVLQYTNSYPAYGYQNHSKGAANSQAMLDFNRERNTMVSSETKVLSFSTQTYDVYYCSAPGISASYRPYRYDIVEYHDPSITSTSEVKSDEINEKNIHGGVNISNAATGGYTQTDQTSSGNSDRTTGKALEGNTFNGISPNETFNEKEYYLKTQGETKPINESLVSTYGGYEASRLGIQFNNSTNSVGLSGVLQSGVDVSSTSSLPSVNKELFRAKNSVHYREHPVRGMRVPEISGEVQCNEGAPQIAGFELPQFFTDEKKPHHTGSVEVIDEGGMRFIFGIPVYSYSQSEVSFSASKRINTTEYNRTGLLQYISGDNSIANDLGRTAAYEKTITPAFATAYLLTEMLSSDYVDRTGDGLSPDDQGNYYKLNYSNPYEGDGNKEDIWKWRLPMCSNEDVAPAGLGFEYTKNLAFANVNSQTDKWDDMANYIYGEKEVWYAASVESKNMIAYFCLEDREDQFSMIDENGGLDLTKPGRAIKKIMLFSKNDLELDPQNAKALQVVEFEYDYSLCPKYVGNKNTYTGNFDKSGKLTLKRIYSYTGGSTENKTTPIEFEYSNVNPDFAFNSTDRWGAYKPNDLTMPNHEFPYAEQGNAAQTNIQAWKLKAVDIVGGSRTEFEYERDDYGYVQDKRAMRMFNVVGMSSTDELQEINGAATNGQGDPIAGSVITSSTLNSINGGNHTYFRNPSKRKEHHNVIYFELDEPISSSNPNPALLVKERYLIGSDGQVPNELYFKMYSKLDNHLGTIDTGFEFVESVAKLGKRYNNGNCFGVAGIPDPNGDYHYGWVILEPEDIDKHKDRANDEFTNAFQVGFSAFVTFLFGKILSEKVNPLQIANWQYARLNAPCNVYGDINYTASVPTEFCDYHLENDNNIFGRNIYKRFNKKEYGLIFDPSKSLVRLYEPDFVKNGGGCRIASVTVTDNWGVYSGETNTSYTQNYAYSDESTSHGVASYEPQVGNNENPFYQFITYDYKRNLLPDERVYQKDPWGELAFPGAGVGYAKVTSSLFDGSVVGSSVEEFWTNRDNIAKTKVQKTPIQLIKKAGEGAIESDSYIKEAHGFSQGFYVETNDYHGKPKKTSIYGKSINGTPGELISTSEIEYYAFSNDELAYLSDLGEIINSASPRDIDMHADSWTSYSSSYNERKGETFSIGFTMAGPIPIPIIRKKKSEDYFFYENEGEAYTFNKVVHHYVVPKAIHTSYLGSRNSARNLYFDEATGDVIVSSLKDEYNDELYSMSYPAHWYYDQCKNMSVTDGAVVKSGITALSASEITSANVPLFEGDRLTITDGSNTLTAWVLEVKQSGGVSSCEVESYLLIDGLGNPVSGINWATASFTIDRTGIKNVLSASMMNVSTKKFPAQSAPNFTFPSTDILSSSAVKFAENKNVSCVPFGDESNAQNYPAQLPTGSVINPFLKGVKGNLRMNSSFAFQQERDESDANTIRQNGTLVNYQPFYALTSCGWRAIDETDHPNNLAQGSFNDWRSLGEVDRFDEFGKPLQSTDQIDVSSAVQYGMNKELKLVQKAQAVNAESTEIGFDGFEDYSYLQSNAIGYVDNDFSLGTTSGGFITAERKHSGDYSLKVVSSVAHEFKAEAAVVDSDHIVDGKYVVQDCDCIQGFAIKPGEDYFLSTWVHENTRVYPFTASEVTLEYLDASNTVIGSETFTPDGAVIDGWQKIEGRYTFPADARALRIKLNTLGNESYFDDFRIHPYLAGMTTTVYDQKNLLPIAQHDGYNYTTFYNYDENLQLVRVRVETVEGIKTISEAEMGSFRKQ